MEKELKGRTEYNNLTKEELEFVASVILGYTTDTDVLSQMDKTKVIKSEVGRKISKNDKKIERLLKTIEYMDPTDENSIRVLLEIVLSLGLGASFLGIEQMPAQNRPLIGILACFSALAMFRQFHDSTNEKILKALYNKLGEVASQNGKLKRIYRDLDEKVTYFEEIQEGNYISLS